jgi:FixJ family two-component response regulator
MHAWPILLEIDMGPASCHQSSPGLRAGFAGARDWRARSDSSPHAWGAEPSGDTSALVFVVDDDESVRRTLEPLLRTAGWRTECFSCAQDFLSCDRAAAASCLVTEVDLPDIDGLELQRRLAAGRGDMAVVFVTRCGDVSTTVRAMKAGAVDFICKPFDEHDVVRAVAGAIERSREMHQQLSRWRERRSLYESLTPRESQVLDGVVCGRLNKQIASDLDISEITVKKHRGSMMRKMKASRVARIVEIVEDLSAAGVYRRPHGGDLDEGSRGRDAVGDGAARAMALQRRA